jgi:NO-binding membrane sensor protein with MHYT domain
MSSEPWLVILSVVVAMQGSYVGLSLARAVPAASGLHRRLLLAGSALTLAVGIWSMHFVGMLAVHFPMDVDFLVLPTLLSFLICVLVVGVGVYVVQSSGPLRVRLALGAIAMGGGIALMHFVGISAVHAGVSHTQSPISVVLALGISVSASGLALWFLERPQAGFPLLGASVLLGLAISGMHYTAMAGLSFSEMVHTHPTAAPALSRESMALVTTIVAFAVSGVFLLSLVPDRPASRAPAPGSVLAPFAPAFAGTSGGRLPDAPTEWPAVSTPDLVPPPVPPGLVAGGGAPLGGAGLPPMRRPVSIPVTREGRPLDLPVESIVAVHANAHYTLVFDGTAKLFCNLPISAMEAQLDPDRFMRVHRSHIVALGRVTAVKRAGDQGLAELDSPVQCSIPVARGRMAQLKAAIRDRGPA